MTLTSRYYERMRPECRLTGSVLKMQFIATISAKCSIVVVRHYTRFEVAEIPSQARKVVLLSIPLSPPKERLKPSSDTIVITLLRCLTKRCLQEMGIAVCIAGMSFRGMSCPEITLGPYLKMALIPGVM